MRLNKCYCRWCGIKLIHPGSYRYCGIVCKIIKQIVYYNSESIKEKKRTYHRIRYQTHPEVRENCRKIHQRRRKEIVLRREFINSLSTDDLLKFVGCQLSTNSNLPWEKKSWMKTKIKSFVIGDN